MSRSGLLARTDGLAGIVRVGVAGLIWGSIPLAMRAADGASVVKVFFRVACAWAVIAAWMYLSGRWRELLRLTPAKVRQVAGQGLILTLNWFLFLSAIDLAPVATAELLAYTGPVFVAFLAPFVTGEPFERRILGPLALALFGIVVIVAPHGLEFDSRRGLLGALFAFASALTYAALLLRAKRILRDISSGALMFIEYAVASLVLAPFVVNAYAQGQGPSGATSYLSLVTLGVVHTALAGFIFLGGLRRVRTDHAAVLTYVEPVSAVLLAAVALGEPLTPSTVAGGLLVVGGGVLVARMEARAGLETVPVEVVLCETCDDEPTGALKAGIDEQRGRRP